MLFTLTSVLEHLCCFFISTIIIFLISCGGGGGASEENVSLNQAPNGVIDSPVGDMTIVAGDSIVFSGTGNDSDGDLPLTYLWNFDGAGIPDSMEEDPGSVQFDNTGIFTVSFTVTDAKGLSDPSPAVRTINVSLNQAPNGVIDSPTGNMTIAAGDSIVFSGTGNDSDGDLPLTYLWNFDGAGIPDSMEEDPGSVQFDNTGMFTVSFTVTDAKGLSDPSPAVRTINVSLNQAPNGVIDSPVGDMTIVAGDSIVFSGTGNDSDGDLPLTYLWNFGGAGIPGSTAEDPGSVQFDNTGMFTVSFTVTDAKGLSDPSPAVRTITAIYDHYVALGDSITLGESDTILADGEGYEPILKGLLNDYFGISSHVVANEGVSGEEASGGLARINDVISDNPDAHYFLIQYGTNDSGASLPVPSGLGLNLGDSGYSGSYKDIMQQIIDAIVAAGMEPLLAKVPIALGPCGNPASCGRYPDPIDEAAQNELIKEYNQVIDEQISANGISVTPPDFYNYFLEDDPDTGEPRYETQYNENDNYHPNGIGYQSMADLWFTALTE